MNITPELLVALGYARDQLGGWHHRDLIFDGSVTEYDEVDGVRYYAIDCKSICTAEELLNCVFEMGVKEGRRRSAAEFRKLIGLRGGD
jgi:hypothetical protein